MENTHDGEGSAVSIVIGKELGDRIRNGRKALGLTIEGLAELTDKSSSYIGLLERGERKPSLKTLEELAAALDMSVDKMFGNPGAATNQGISVSRRKLNIYVNKLEDSQIEQLVRFIKVFFFVKQQ